MDSASVTSATSRRSSRWKRKKKRQPATETNEDAKPIAEEKPKVIQLCLPCQREERNAEATHFCDNCQEDLCPACVHQHSKFPTMKDHVIHGKDGEPIPVVPLKLDKCDKHDGKSLDMYCYDHDAVHCAACIAIDHRKCKQVSYLPEAAKNIAESQEYKELIENIARVKDELATSKVRRQEDNTRLIKEREDAIARIKYVRKTINRCLDSLEKRTLDNLEAEFVKYNKKVTDDMATCDEIIGKLESMVKRLQEDLHLDDSSRFIQMRKANQTVKRGERTVESLAKAKGSEQIQFLPDARVNDLIRSIPALGSFATEQQLLTGTLVGQFDIHLAVDISDCQLLGSDFLPDGRSLVSDWENKKVKLLSSSFKVLDYLKLSGCPYSICSINQTEGVVCITNKKILQFFTIDERNKMALGRVQKMTEFCRDVAYKNGKVYVVCGALKEGGVNQVSVYSLDGQFVRNIVTDPDGENLFLRPLYVTLNSIGNIFVCDEDKGLISLDNSGEVIGVFSDQKVLKYPYGLAIVNNDQIFVCGFGSHNIVQVGRNLMLLGEVLSESAGLRNPRSVCYDVNSQRILVTCKNTNFVRVYSLK